MINIRFMFVFFTLFLSISPSSFAEGLTSDDMERYLKSEKRIIVYGEQFVDFGEFSKANELLSKAIKKFPNSDIVLSLYGKSLYESGQKDKAENFFMQALRLNSANIIAQQYIEQIRDVRSLSVSEESQAWAAIVNDKIGDLIVFVLSIWVGTSFNSFWRWGLRKWRWRNAKKSYEESDFDDVVRILELHVIEMEQDAIDETLKFMMSSNVANGADAARKIINEFIVRDESLAVLLRSIELLEKTHNHTVR